MGPVVITLLVILGIVVLLAFWLIAVYNGLVVGLNRFKNPAEKHASHRREQSTRNRLPARTTNVGFAAYPRQPGRACPERSRHGG